MRTDDIPVLYLINSNTDDLETADRDYRPMTNRTPPLDLGLLQEQSTRSNLLPKLNELGKLYDLRERQSSGLRFGVKSRTIKLPSFFSNIRESLKVENTTTNTSVASHPRLGKTLTASVH